MHVIIVLGTGNKILRNERVRKAVLLHMKYNYPMIFSGKKSIINFNKMPTEARLMMEYAVSLGVNKKKIILEEKSVDTITNALFSLRICKDNGFTNVIVVSSKSHMWRVKLIFKIFNGKVRFVSA